MSLVPVLGPTKVFPGGQIAGAPFDGLVTSPFDPGRLPIMTPNGLTGWGHFAVDLMPWDGDGTAIIAPCDFEVTFSGNPVDGGLDLAGGQGMFGRINSDWGIGFWHMEGLQLDVGHQVRRGDVIGQVGNSGLSTGAHLHFMLLNTRMNAGQSWYPPTTFVNPMEYFHVDPASVPPFALDAQLITGPLPTMGSASLMVVMQRADATSVVAELRQKGVEPASLWKVSDGTWFRYIVGAPERVSDFYSFAGGEAVYVQA